MVRINVQGIHRVRKTLSGGRQVEYHYAWRGGPRFWRSDDGIPEAGPDYFAAYKTALESRNPSKGLFREIIRAYLDSAEFRKLKPRSAQDIKRSLYHPKGIDAKFGDAPIAVFNRAEIRRVAYAWRDQFKPRQADHMMAHLSAIVSWAVDRNWLHHHHLLKITKLYEVDRSDIIWTDAEIDAFVEGAPAYVARILIAATETGLRPGDLMKLSRAHVQTTPQGKRILMRTGKRNRMVSIPVTPKMAQLIAETPPSRMLILGGAQGEPYSAASQLGRVVTTWRNKLGLRSDLHLYDARGTAATRLFQAGASLQQIATTMGWSPAHAAKMIEVYVSLNPAAADDVLVKLIRER